MFSATDSLCSARGSIYIAAPAVIAGRMPEGRVSEDGLACERHRFGHIYFIMKMAPCAQPMVSRHETASCASTAPPRMVRNFFKLSSGHLLPPKLPPLLSYTSSLPNGRYLLQVCRLVTHPPYRISNSFSHQVKLIGRRHMNCLRKKTGCHRSR